MEAMEAALVLAKGVCGAVLLVRADKPGRTLADTPDAARETRAEAWRSGRSLRNVRIKLASAQALDEGSGGVSFSSITRAQPRGAELDRVIRAAFDRLIAAAAAQPDSLVEIGRAHV